jgi:ABC-type Fe3+-hydroxamate transport system substrate-binding protein
MDFKDQLGRVIKVDDRPVRIVSAVPSQTELLFDLGLDEEVIAITKFCVHPDTWRKQKTIIGGTKNLNIEKIRELNPDLIIANKEENEPQQINALSETFPVWVSDISNLNDALEMIGEIGRITHKQNEAFDLIKSIQLKFELLAGEIKKPGKRILYLIWQEPYLSVGNDTFIHDMLDRCKFKSVTDIKLRYPDLSHEEIISLDPEIILLSSEPYPFSGKHLPEFEEKFPNAMISLVDGEMFSWYGSRLEKMPEYFKSIIDEINSAS